MRVLLIEDDVALASFMKRGLELDGHAVSHAADGESGMAAAVSAHADVIVLDLNLPRMDGLAVLRHLRDGGLDAKIVVLTGRGSVAERIACLDAGADDFVTKPFSFHELTARCRAVMRRGQASPGSQTVRHGALLVDRLARTVRLHDEEIVLTAKEFALLDYLLMQRGRAVGRPELLEKVWKLPADSGTNVVDVYINYLRRKLHTSKSDEDLILTVRGSGYTLAPETPAVLPVRKPVASAGSVASAGLATLLSALPMQVGAA